MEAGNAESMRCPTCRAVQDWSDTCRRCKCDLRLLRAAAAAYVSLRRQCLQNLRENREQAALEQARQCLALRDDLETRRLFAVCELLNGHWDAARACAVRQLAEPLEGAPA